MKGLLAPPLVAVIALIAQTQAAQVTPFPSKLITIASYDDKLHFWTFPGGIRDATIKPFAVVVTNSTDRPVVAAHVVWNWIAADGKPPSLVQQHNTLTAHYGFVVNANSMSLILPNGTFIRKGGSIRTIIGDFFSHGQRSSTATQIHVALDAVVLSDGQVIGPDTNHLIANLQGETEAAARMKTIINTAKAEGRDPQPDIQKAIADEPRGSATGRYLVLLMNSNKMGGGQWQVPPRMQLPHFYRK